MQRQLDIHPCSRLNDSLNHIKNMSKLSDLSKKEPSASKSRAPSPRPQPDWYTANLVANRQLQETLLEHTKEGFNNIRQEPSDPDVILTSGPTGVGMDKSREPDQDLDKGGTQTVQAETQVLSQR